MCARSIFHKSLALTFPSPQKKKCDERRPQCARCVEKSLACTYEAVKPRQRKKRDSISDAVPYIPQLDHIDTENESWDHDEQIEEIGDETCTSVADILQDVLQPQATTEELLTPTTPSVFEFPRDIPGEEDDQLSLVRRNSGSGIASALQCLQSDLAAISPCSVTSPRLEFSIPAFSEFSDRPNRRALVDHFCNVLSHLIVFREESGNPWQQLILPLSYNNSPVMNAIYALASAHLECRGVDTGEKSMYFHHEAIQGLAQLIEGGGKADHKNEILAAIMVLVYYEAVSRFPPTHACMSPETDGILQLVQRGRSNIVDGHLRGALTIMESSPGDSNPTSIFLERV